jgi:HAD superfamily hydrolase (TIGR01509 family)
MISTVIFDLDGLLADTEKLHFGAYQDVFGRLGIEISERTYGEHWIRDGKGIRDFVTEQGLDLDADLLRREKSERYEELVRSTAEAMPGAVAALDRLSGHKTLALATASDAAAAQAVLETLGMQRYFAHTATKESAARMKPSPDVFLSAAAALGVSPDVCVVLEDAEKGVLAAHAAGMRCIAVPNVHTRDNDFSRATLVLSSLHELTVESIDALEH